MYGAFVSNTRRGGKCHNHGFVSYKKRSVPDESRQEVKMVKIRLSVNNIKRTIERLLIGRLGSIPRGFSVQFITAEKVVNRSSNRGMDLSSTINFLSNEDTSGLAPRYFIGVLTIFQTSVIYL
jgi:hypothetical protein